MRFQKQSRLSVSEYEEKLISYWQKNHIFEKSVEQRPTDNSYVFYDGPPFITGVPHYGTLLSSIVKDAVARFWTMKGKRVERVWGWDCHGLPAEVFTEKKLGINDKRDVYKIGLETYINTCRENMIQTGSEWEDTINRIGRWVDFKGAYRTMDKDYMESVWWAFKKLYDDGKIYEGEKVLLYCTRDATPLSKAEIAMDNSYKNVTDPSVYVKFKLADEENTYVLAWTTTPWTLPANTALAVNEGLTYSQVAVGADNFIIATELLDKVLTDEKHQPVAYTTTKSFKGSELVGRRYEPLFGDRGHGAHSIYHADYVNLDEGTGIVHIAPAYGEEDYQLAQEYHIPVLSVIDDNGFYNTGEWMGQLVWETDKTIAKELRRSGVVWKIEYVEHSYPHCYRCGTKLMYRAHPSWFMNIDDQRTQMLEQNSNIHWFPAHIKDGRFAHTILSAPDWNLSRDRFWATPMPIWKGTDSTGKEVIKVVGSYQELKDLSGQELEDYHRPWVDNITFELNGVSMHRIDKVMDCWFESGSMPFAQFHYPFENVKKFESNFPGDFIAEYVGQVRAWFYYLHTISVGLFGKEAFRNVIVTGTLMGNDGRKLSKSYGNFTDPNKLLDQYGSDSLRYLLLSSPVLNGEDASLQDKDVADISRRLAMIWNMYDFFCLYASVDNWEWDGSLADPTDKVSSVLDLWIVSRVHQVQQLVGSSMLNYDLPQALKPIMQLIDDASNWYVRRSRRRFWKSTNDDDKQQAYTTLHYVLVQMCLMMAPFTPFLSEELYRHLTGDESVHLCDWPDDGHVNEVLISEMATVRDLITEGLSQRAKHHIKVRQPLSVANLVLPFQITDTDNSELKALIAEELNVKEIKSSIGEVPSITIDTNLTDELKQEGLVKEIIRHVQQARKDANLDVDNRINLMLKTPDPDITASIAHYKHLVEEETLATLVETLTGADLYETSFELTNVDVKILLAKKYLTL
jgi:isoleucyl-tRNA synthetase